MSLADVVLTIAPKEGSTDLAVHVRHAFQDDAEPGLSGTLPAAALSALLTACATLRRARDAESSGDALLQLGTQLNELSTDADARPGPLAALRGLCRGAGSDPRLPAHRVILECRAGDAHAVLFEALGAGPHWPGLVDQWQWLRYVRVATRLSEPGLMLDKATLNVTCVLGSLEQRPNLENERHAALSVVRDLRSAAAQQPGAQRSALTAKFLVASAELPPLLATARAQHLDDVIPWLERLSAAAAAARPADALVAGNAAVLIAELEHTPPEVLVWLGHGSAAHKALILAGNPDQAPSEQRLPLATLAQALRTASPCRTRLLAVLACHTASDSALQCVEHIDHVVVTDGYVHPDAAAGFAVTLLARLAALDPVGEAVRVARRAGFSNPLDRWHVQHWARTLDARPFVDRSERAVAEYLRLTPEQAPGEERSALDVQPDCPERLRPADWHIRHCVDLHVDESYAVVGRGAATQEPREAAERWWFRQAHDRALGLPLRALLAAAHAPRPQGSGGGVAAEPLATAGRWLILGEPGSGKSTMLQRERILLAGAPDRPFVPVFVKLSTWARLRPELSSERLRAGEAFDLEAYVESRMEMVGTGLAAGLRQRAARGEVCYLLDGLDEVGSEADQVLVHGMLTGLAAQRRLCPIVVTSRPVEAQSYELTGFTRAGLRPLEAAQQQELLRLRLGGDAERASSLLRHWGQQPTLRELARNPLFLTLLADTADDAQPDATRPHEVLDRVVTWLLDGKHRPRTSKGPAWPKAMRLDDAAEAAALLAFAWTQQLADTGPRQAVVEFFGDELWGELLPSDADRAKAIKRAMARIDKAFEGDTDGFLDQLTYVGLLNPHRGDGRRDTALQFSHRMLQENLASRALADRWTGDGRAELWRLAEQVSSGEGRAGEQQLRFWAEPFALMAGRVDNPDEVVQALVAEAKTRPIGLRALVNAKHLTPATIEATVRGLDDWQDRQRVYEALVERIDEGEVVQLVARLARSTSNGNDLFFLHLVLERLAARGGALARTADAARERLFDHLEPTAADMRGAFTHVPGRPEHPAFCAIPAGVFDMGDDDAGREPGVEIKHPFWIGATPVTVGQYRLFDPRHRSTMAGETQDVRTDSTREQRQSDAFPVVDVTWYASVSFTRWLTRWRDLLPRGASGLPVERLHASLPSEAQWEYAARAGSQGRFWFGEDDADLRRHGRSREDWGKGPFPVGTASDAKKPPGNNWGLLDVHGGVWEWCSGDYDGDRRAEIVEPGSSASARVLRGGSFNFRPDFCRSAYRGWDHPALADGDDGLRVVLAARPQLALAIEDRS